MGPLKVAHLNGLSVSRPPLHNDFKDEPETASNDERVRRFGIYNEWNVGLKTNEICLLEGFV